MSHWVRIDPAPRGMRFSSQEVVQIFVAVAALTLAFALVLAGGLARIDALIRSGGPLLLLFVIGASFIAVVTAFLLHELAHKALAQRYGCFAEFRYYPMGLLLGILTAAFGFIFAAPGAVMISGPVNPRQHVRISAVGPGTNLVVAVLFVGLAVAIGATGSLTADLTSILVSTVAFVNLFLGGFNLIPFPPLDGSKIFAFDKPLWVGMVVLLALVYVGGRSVGVF